MYGATSHSVERAQFLQQTMHLTTFKKHAETGARACAIALGFSIPISVALDNVLLAIILACWIFSGDYRDKFEAAKRNGVAMAALCLFFLLAAGVTYSQAGMQEGMQTLAKYIDLAFIPVFASLFRREHEQRLAWLAFGWAIALTVVFSYLIWLGLVGDTPLTLGTEQNPVVFKKYLTQSVFLGFGAYVLIHLAGQTSIRRERITWAIGAMLCVLNVLLLSKGRTGQIIVLALALFYFFSRWRRRGILVAIAVITIMLGALMIGNTDTGARIELAVQEWKDSDPAKAATEESSVGIRLEFYRNSLQIIREHPLFGTGTGSFPKVYADHVAATTMTPTTNPHNEYLNIGVQLGIVGLFALLGLFISAWRLAPRLQTLHERELAHALIITFAIGCAFNSLLMDHAEGLFFAWASGLLFAGLRSTENSRGAAR